MVVVFVTICLLAAAFMFVPPKQSPTSGFNINVNEKAVVKVSQENGTVHLDIDYDSNEDKPSDVVLFPEVFDDDENDLNVAFWRKVSGFDSLSKEEQQQVKLVLCRHGFTFNKEEDPVDDNSSFAVPEDPSDMAPVSPDPSHDAAYDDYKARHTSHDSTLDDNFGDDDDPDRY